MRGCIPISLREELDSVMNPPIPLLMNGRPMNMNSREAEEDQISEEKFQRKMRG